MVPFWCMLLLSFIALFLALITQLSPREDEKKTKRQNYVNPIRPGGGVGVGVEGF